MRKMCGVWNAQPLSFKVINNKKSAWEFLDFGLSINTCYDEWRKMEWFFTSSYPDT